jgi:hypothetical protein
VVASAWAAAAGPRTSDEGAEMKIEIKYCVE